MRFSILISIHISDSNLYFQQILSLIPDYLYHIYTCTLLFAFVGTKKAPHTHRRINLTHPRELSKFVNYGDFERK